VNQGNATSSQKIKSVPDLLRKEALAAVLVLALALLVSAVFDAPIEGPADPAGLPDENVKAPWIFVGIQQLLRYLHPLAAGVLFPLAAVVALCLVPLLSRYARRTAAVIFAGIVFGFLILTIWGYFR